MFVVVFISSLPTVDFDTYMGTFEPWALTEPLDSTSGKICPAIGVERLFYQMCPSMGTYSMSNLKMCEPYELHS